MDLDSDLEKLTRDELVAEVKKLRAAILLAMIVPTVGPPPVAVPALAVLMLCSSAELLRYGWWEKVKGAVGLALGGFALNGTVSYAFPHFMMTGRI